MCRLYWENGGLVMLTSAMIMSCGALAVALIDDRVPVFEIVVCHHPPVVICVGVIKRLCSVSLSLPVYISLSKATMPSVMGAGRRELRYWTAVVSQDDSLVVGTLLGSFW